MAKSIRLHKKYGLNPTIPLCFICRKPFNELILLGAGYKERAPMYMVVGLRICEDCRARFLAIGVLCVQTDKESSQDKWRATGNYIVVSNDAWSRLFTTPIPEKKIAILDSVAFDALSKLVAGMKPSMEVIKNGNGKNTKPD